MSVFLTTGSGPYAAFFYAIEGFTQPILSEVAIAVANKIKSALLSAASGWLGFGGKVKDEGKEKPPKIEPATPLPLRFGLPDKRREGEIIILSPCNNYAATTDSFGRVILIDVQRGMAVRIWKGYRDGQLGWIEVKEENVEPGKGDHVRLAQFLIIYAPRRGILEVWLAVHGPRVAAFNVNKNCRLVCPCYGMMGLNNVTCRGARSKVFQCALIDPEGVVKTIDIPFHLALSDKSSTRARDLHLLKKLKTILKESSEDREGLEDTLREILLDMKVASIAHQAIERILSSRYIPVSTMTAVVKASIKKLQAKPEESLDLDSRMMLKFCLTQKALLTVYSSMQQLNTNVVEDRQLSSMEILTKTLKLSVHDAESALRMLTNHQLLTRVPEVSKTVTFELDTAPLAVTSFLHAFSYRSLFTAEEETTGKSRGLNISKEATEDRKLAVGDFLFGGCLNGRCQAAEVLTVLGDVSIATDQIMALLLSVWLSVKDRTLQSVVSFYELVQSISASADVDEVVNEPNTTSQWWSKVRNICCQSENCQSAYLAVLACRAASAQISGEHKQKDPDADSASEASDTESEIPAPGKWERLTVETDSWEVLLRQLEDIVAISTLLQLPSTQASEPSQSIKVSVSSLLNSGKGAVSEVIARYVVQQQFNPPALFYSFSTQEVDKEKEVSCADSTQTSTETTSKTEERSIESMNVSEKVKYQMDQLRQHFPHSLHNDILLANCSWEYLVTWNKDPEVTHNLELSLEFLRLVQNAVLREGVSSLMWHMFLLKRVSSAAHLIEKVGKPPKDRLCRKEVGVSDSALRTFISLCADFMEIIMDANCEANEVPVCNTEQQWQSASGPASLLELAVDQKTTNYGLLRLHFHLLKIMSAVLSLGLKSAKVLSLFDNKGRAALFKELYSHPLLPNQKVEQDLAVARRSFLCRAISSAVSTIDAPSTTIPVPSSTGTSTPSPTKSTSPLKRQKSQFPMAFKWPQVALMLGKDFGLDLDYLKRCHACELYSYGHDRLAEEILSSVNDQEEMGQLLLNMAGERVAYEMFRRDLDGNFQYLASMSTTLTRWLKTLDPEKLKFNEVPLKQTVLMIEQAASRLKEGGLHHELATELLEKTRMLSDVHDS